MTVWKSGLLCYANRLYPLNFSWETVWILGNFLYCGCYCRYVTSYLRLKVSRGASTILSRKFEYVLFFCSKIVSLVVRGLIPTNCTLNCPTTRFWSISKVYRRKQKRTDVLKESKKKLSQIHRVLNFNGFIRGFQPPCIGPPADRTYALQIL